MKTAKILALSVAVFLSAFAQAPDSQKHGRGMGPERLEKYKKLRLIEALNLNEEDAVRFTAKYTAHENTTHELMKARMDMIDRMEEAVRSKDSEKDLPELFVRLEENEQKMFDERKRFHGEIKGMLTPEQMAKFYVFDRNFTRGLREAMMEMRRERRGQ